MGIFSSAAKEPPVPYLETDDDDVDEEFQGPLNKAIVMLYSYVGTGCHGLQYNINQLTIETFLFRALGKAKLIPKDAYLNLNKIRWHEASRTDVGVHAATQTLSFRVHLADGIKAFEVCKMIQENMPPASPITVHAVIFSQNFNAQRFADGRRYQYLMPLHTFKEQTKEHLQFINETILPHFVGTKNYHNYTKRISAKSESAIRTIWKFEISEPFKLNREQYVCWTIHGQSFMLNQIRKMIATALCVSYGLLSIDNLDKTFTEERWALSKLPGDGLFLDKVEYTAWKKKNGNKPGNDVEFETFRPSVEKWKNDVLYPSITSHVAKTDLFRIWVNTVMKEFPPVPQDDNRAESEGKRRRKKNQNE
ncbi:tRNA pseudouridine synthase family protein [Tritrichomonas foetus]|uniref:tRNA pseudouridine synthase family protein n=1 Tax=Tritrichomonas foetus TaxID=1144522 RepID=A0A1J4JAR5_9EUKA|nr:tRNA pseudouridine synthase family protein [Tritrichomonas foetus]|eukprot:OHS94525.1 tRNA pseudouridine synthase family protein [Tritrichomonas foetus]